jgi:hypothetical protein
MAGGFFRTATETPPRAVGQLAGVLRGGWAVLITAFLGTFIAAIPVRYRELSAFIAQVEASGAAPNGGLLSWLLTDPAYQAIVLATEIVFVATFAVVSTLIAWGHTHDWRALFFSAVFIGYPVWVTPTLYAVQPVGVAGYAVQIVHAAGLLLALHFFLLFPDGRFVPGWTRAASVFWIGYTAVWVVDPRSVLALTDPFDATMVAFVALMAGWTTGMIAQGARHRVQDDPVQRRQTRLVLLAIGAAIIGYGAVYLTGVALPAAGTARLVYDAYAIAFFLLLALPIAIALTVSMWRHHLFDFGMVVNRTIVYVALSATAAAVYLVGVVAVPNVLPITSDSDLLVAGSTLTVAALFAPGRRRIQSFVDRRFYRSRYDARVTLEHFVLRLRRDVDLVNLEGELRRVAIRTFQPRSVTVWLPERR